ncbi:hypothetical protein BH10CHL1_BH10CHL1_33140 [soil metagenome]
MTAPDAAFSLQCPAGTPVAFAVSGSGSATVTLDPISDLPAGVTCAWAITGGQITDVDSYDPPDSLTTSPSGSFTTLAAVDQPPAVSAVTPADGATGVNSATTIVFSFSEPVTGPTNAFSLECPVGTPLAFTDAGANTNTRTLFPSAPLPANTICRVTLQANGINDLDGIDPATMAQNFVTSFTTSPAAAAYDYGDAPDPTFPTLGVNSGARHLLNGNLSLGATIDAESDGQPNANATGDDANGDDEDGVSFPAELFACEDSKVSVSASAPGVLNAWIDFNGDGDWNDLNEQIAHSLALQAGAQNVPLSVPCTVLLNQPLAARFRLSSAAVLGYSGDAPDGEVEDYTVSFAYGAPLAINDYTSMGEDAAVLIDVLANDSDPLAGALTITAVGAPAHGTAIIEGRAIRYTPGPNFNGADRFTYTIVNATNKTAQGTVQLGIRSVNDAPTDVLLSNDTLTMTLEEGGARTYMIPAGTAVGVLDTVDPDANDPHTYRLSGPDADKFVIEGNLLRTAKLIEVELPQSTPDLASVSAASTSEVYEVNVQTEDGQKKVFSELLRVNTTIAGTSRPSVIGSQVGPYFKPEVSFPENRVPNAPNWRGYYLFVYYVDKGKETNVYPPYTFTLVDGKGADDNQYFSLNREDGSYTKLSPQLVFDYETKRTYSVRVRMIDGRGQQLDQQMVVHVINEVLEPPPTGLANCRRSSLKLIDKANTVLELTNIQASSITPTDCKFSATLKLRLYTQSFSFDVAGAIDVKGQVTFDDPLDDFTLNIAGLSLKVSEADIEYYQDRPSLRLTEGTWCVPAAWGGSCMDAQEDSLLIDSSGLRLGGGFKLPLPDVKVGKSLTISSIEGQIKPVAGGYELTGAGEFGLPKFQKKGVDGCSLEASVTIYTDAKGATVLEIQAATVAAPNAFGLREVSVGLSCDKGIPIDSTGLELTGVSGKLSLRDGDKFVELAVKVESTGKLGSVRIATIEASAKVLWEPEWGLDLMGTVKLLTYFEMAKASTSVRDSRISFSGEIRAAIVKGALNLNAWTDRGGSLTVTGSGKVTFGIAKGAILKVNSESCSNETSRACESFFSWVPFFGRKITEKCKDVTKYVCRMVGIYVPSADLQLGTIGADFGKFNNGNYGVKGYYEIGQILANAARAVLLKLGVPEKMSAFFDQTGKAEFGKVDKYQLVKPPTFAAALARYQSAQSVQAAGGGMSVAPTDGITVISDHQLSIATPLTAFNTPAVSAAGVISQVRVTAPSTVTFILTSNLTPTLSLIAPDGTTITPSNYNQPPISQQYTIQYHQMTVYSTMELVDEADHGAPRLRFVNLSAHASLSAVDVLVDGVPAWSNVTPLDAASLENSDSVDYIELEPGQHVLRIVPTGQSTTILSTTVYAEPNRGYTLFTSGTTAPQLRLVDDKNSVPPSFGQMYTRFVHVGDASRKINVLINGTPIISNLGYGETSAYQLIPNGNLLLEVKDATNGQALVPARQLTPSGTMVSTVFLFDHNTGVYPMDYSSVIDDIYLPQVYTVYNVGHAGVGDWKVDVSGDLSDPILTLAVISFPTPPSLSNVTVNAATLSQTQVAWKLRADYAPTTVRLYANPGDLNSTLVYTDSNNQPVSESIVNYAGYPISEIKVTDPAQLAGAVGTLTADLSKLESGTYRLWVEVDDGVSPSLSAYATNPGSGEIAVITVDNSANFPLTWSPTITTVLDSANRELFVGWSALAHPDVESYTMYLGTTPGAPDRSVADISAFYNRDDQGNPVGMALGTGAFGNITPGVYYLSLEANDEDSGRKVRSNEIKLTIGAGDYTLTTPAARYTVAPSTTITIPVSLVTAQALFYPNVPLSINDYGLPSGIFVQFADDLSGDSFLSNSSGTVAFAATGATAQVLAPVSSSSVAAPSAEQTVNLIVTVDPTTAPGVYPFTLIGHNEANNQMHSITIVVGDGAVSNRKIFLPLIGR